MAASVAFRTSAPVQPVLHISGRGSVRSLRTIETAGTGHDRDPGRAPMIDQIRRNVLATGVAAAATAAAPQVFAQPVAQGATTGFYQKGNVRIRYQEVGSGFPLLATP